MKARIVIGANFGDEGKGLMTDYLCSQGAGIVVRFNGGAQAGHTVVTPEGDRHVFHHFGSGSFLGIPTFLSQFFICNPILFFAELKQLNSMGFYPEVYAHPDCLVTTYVDMLINQSKENTRGNGRHGSCGIGFHETMNRSQIKHLKITMGDLWNGGSRLESQLAELCDKYAEFRMGKKVDEPEAVSAFIQCAHELAEYVNPLGMGQCKDPVFEGAQGLLLDQDNKEFFPHVTHSKTGMHNVEILCQQAGITDKEIFYVSRSYLTRHGAGKLPGEDSSLSYKDETNMKNAWQGTIRFAPLDTNSLAHRIKEDAGSNPFNLVITHMDQKEIDCECSLVSNGPSRSHVSPKTSSVIVA